MCSGLATSAGLFDFGFVDGVCVEKAFVGQGEDFSELPCRRGLHWEVLEEVSPPWRRCTAFTQVLSAAAGGGAVELSEVLAWAGVC